MTDNETHTFGINRIPRYGRNADVFSLASCSTGSTNFSPIALQALKDADGKNPALAINEAEECVELDTPGPEGTGHHSGFPDDSPCQP